MCTVLASDPTPLVHFLMFVPLVGAGVSIACTLIVVLLGRGRLWCPLLLVPNTAFGLWFVSVSWKFFVPPPAHDTGGMFTLLAILATIPLIASLVGWYLWWGAFSSRD